MKTIWKWTLGESTVIEMPRDAKILTVQEQHGRPQLWALVDTDAPKVHRVFNIHRTGEPMPIEPGHYIGTFQLDNGACVFHVFEMGA
jgi:hypothetical protein